MSTPYHRTVFHDERLDLRVNLAGEQPDGTFDADTLRLNLYARLRSGPPQDSFTLSLGVEDAARLHAQLDAVSVIRDTSQQSTGRFVEVDPSKVTPEVMAAVKENPDLVEAVLQANPEAVRKFVELKLTDREVVGLAYRRDQLAVMDTLLDDPNFFQALQAKNNCRGKEALWQLYFEHNHWVFGYGLAYIIGDAFSAERLEQVTTGYSVAGPGKRADALMKTAGLIQSLCFVEIKTHETALLGKEYRKGCWQPSEELTGAIAQSQGTVQKAIESIGGKLPEIDADGYTIGQLYNVHPRSFVVVGSLSEFRDDKGNINEAKFKSFEQYRRSLVAPEVLTFDELHQRASMIVDATPPQEE